MRILLVALLFLGGCAIPRIIILNDPLNARQHNDLGVSYEQRKELDLALREYESAAKLANGWARPLINRGNVFAAKGDWRKADNSYRQALKREPDSAEAMNNLAWVLLQSGETAEALQWAQKAVSASPADARYLDTLAEVQVARGDHAAARQTLSHALALSPDAELRSSMEKKLGILDTPHF